MIGEFSQLAYQGLYYIGTGPLLPNIAYFIYQQEWARRNSFSDKDNSSVKKVLTRTWDNKLDWWTLAVLVVSAGFQVLFYLSVILAFKAARQAGLNIGIATAIWSFVPFFVAFMERVLYGVGIRLF